MVNSNSKLQKSVFCLSLSKPFGLDLVCVSFERLFVLRGWFCLVLGVCSSGNWKKAFLWEFFDCLGREEISRERERWDCFWRHGGKDWRESERERERE